MSTPAFRIIADGNDVTDAIKDRLLSLRINDAAGQESDSLEISLDDRDSLLPLPRSGAWLRVWLGYSSGGKLPVYMGAYAVDEIELSMGPRSMVIKATAAQTAPELVKGQRTESWHDRTMADVVNKIAKRNGLTPVIKGGLGSVKIKHEDQTNESDQSFLTRLAKKYKATIKPADGKLIVTPRSTGAGEFAITVDEVTDWRATLKNRGAYGAVKVKYLDRKLNKEKNETFGKKGPLPVFEEKQLFRDQAEAKKAAESRLQSLKAGEVRVSLRLPGRPDLNADGLVTLKNFRPYVDGTWAIKQITHELTSSGYSTSIECGTAGEGDSNWVGGAAKNDSKPAAEKAKLTAKAAEAAKDMNTKGGPAAPENACVFAVNKVLQTAGISPPWGNLLSVPTALSTLAEGAGTLLKDPKAGAIAIMRDSIGIVQNDGTIISNSATKGTFSKVTTPDGVTSQDGQAPAFYRIK